MNVKRLILILVILAVGAYLFNTYLKNQAREKADREKAERIERSIRSAVDQMVSRFNARTDWPEKLVKGKPVRVEKILSIELEKLWLVERPTLFLGSIEDISTTDQETYCLRIESSLLRGYKHLFLGQLGLELKCPKNMLDSFLERHPDLFSNFGLNNGVAVIARIDQIKTQLILKKEEGKEEMIIGMGDCLDITYTGNIRF